MQELEEMTIGCALQRWPHATNNCLARRIDPLELIRGRIELVTVKFSPAVMFAFLSSKVGTCRRSVHHLSLNSRIDGSHLDWWVQSVFLEAMSEDLLFGKIAEPELTAVNFTNHIRDRMGEVERRHL